MKRARKVCGRIVISLGLLAAVLALGVGRAAAEPPSLDLAEAPEAPVDVTTVVTYATALPGLGEVLSDALAVTDDELASVGSMDVAAPLLAGPPLFVVDDDLQQCPNADFTTATGIQQAIAAAPPGASIEVCAGTYTPINVNKPLTIYHPVQHGQATQCAAAVVPDPTKDATIDAGNTAAIAVTLAANDIVLYGFHVQNTNGNPGIYTLPTFSGYRLESNVVQLNTFGIYLNASGATETIVRRNCIRLNNRPGAAGGNGIYSDQGLHNALVEENFITQQNVAAMVFALNQSDLTITHNDDIDGNTIVLVDVQGAYVAYNHLVRTAGSGIFVGGGVTDATLTHNLIEHPGGTGITVNTQFSVAANQLLVEKNKVVGSPFDGIRFNNTSNSSILRNTVTRNVRDGIRLQNNSDNNLVDNNLSRDNGRDGIRVDVDGSSGNTIQQNTAIGNTEHDCHDDTVGLGTGGTANLWIKDVGKTENRPGLCKNKP
jgi:parallel beta-helix repeat protein